MIKKRWVADNSRISEAERLAVEADINLTLARILVNRNITSKKEVEEFLNPSLSEFFNPFLLNDMEKAVERIKKGINKGETLCIYGDYDVDGVTSSAILTRYLRDKVNVINYIPDREKEGYGVNKNALSKIKEMGADLVITVDCGISSFEEIEFGKSIGLEFIVTDHHTCPEILPDCIAVINPKRADSTYPFKELCGAGVAFKLVCALGETDLSEYIAICAIGTVADIVPLISENRIIVYHGIKFLKENALYEINLLLKEAGLSSNNIDSSTLGFVIAPRINASGRMADAKDALLLFLEKDEEKVREKAVILNEKNLLRQETEKKIYNEVKKIIEDNPFYESENIIIVSGEDWHEGVIGIVASKITEEYHKPCVLISMGEKVGKGSVRSIKGFNIYDALKTQENNLIKFGGHELAAGLTVSKDKYPEFKKGLEAYAKEVITDSMKIPELKIDAEIFEEDMNEDFVNELKQLEPYGMGNSQPNFFLRDAEVISSFAFKENKHLRLSVSSGNKTTEAVGFNMGEYARYLKEKDKIYIVGNININEFRGIKKFQIRIKDIKRRV